MSHAILGDLSVFFSFFLLLFESWPTRETVSRAPNYSEL